ncbi:MAG TPA: hypothetical protein VFI47_07400, partial [Acidimicrobiales bacterium]|nr:hypothetical protein [Acidimicrobiales bacterium]
RVFRVRQDGDAWPAQGPEGLPTVLGAGPLGFRCIEPFRTWTMTFAGPAVQTSTFDLVEGRTDGPLVDVRFEVEATMAVPPWVQGTLQAESGARLESSIEGDLMGGRRYEQLFRATGSVRVGAQEHAFTGSGLRIRRQGVRRLAGFWGHCWQSALFGSGRAFGYIAYPPRPDGEPTFNEGYVFSGDGGLEPARVVEAPWLTRLQPLGEDVSLVLETRRGTVRIEGETIVSAFDIHHDDKTFVTEALKQETSSFPAVNQGGARYRWDGEEAFGMIERSYPLDKIARG